MFRASSCQAASVDSSGALRGQGRKAATALNRRHAPSTLIFERPKHRQNGKRLCFNDLGWTLVEAIHVYEEMEAAKWEEGNSMEGRKTFMPTPWLTQRHYGYN